MGRQFLHSNYCPIRTNLPLFSLFFFCTQGAPPPLHSKQKVYSRDEARGTCLAQLLQRSASVYRSPGQFRRNFFLLYAQARASFSSRSSLSSRISFSIPHLLLPPSHFTMSALNNIKGEAVLRPSSVPTSGTTTPNHGHRASRSALVGYVAPEFSGKAEQKKAGKQASKQLVGCLRRCFKKALRQ